MGFFRKLFRRGSNDEAAPTALMDQPGPAVAEEVGPALPGEEVPVDAHGHVVEARRPGLRVSHPYLRWA